MSLVDVAPSTIRSLNEWPTASRSMASRWPASTWASVVSTASMVAMSGASMAAPLAIPPTVKPVPLTTTCLRAVSVVIIARAASSPPSRRAAFTSGSTPDSMAAIGRW